MLRSLLVQNIEAVHHRHLVWGLLFCRLLSSLLGRFRFVPLLLRVQPALLVHDVVVEAADLAVAPIFEVGHVELEALAVDLEEIREQSVFFGRPLLYLAFLFKNR